MVWPSGDRQNNGLSIGGDRLKHKTCRTQTQSTSSSTTGPNRTDTISTRTRAPTEQHQQQSFSIAYEKLPVRCASQAEPSVLDGAAAQCSHKHSSSAMCMFCCGGLSGSGAYIASVWNVFEPHIWQYTYPEPRQR